MAMNKAEKAELERMKTLAAFHRTEFVDRDVPIPTSCFSTGFDIIGVLGHKPSVQAAWSTSVSHGIGNFRNGSGSQRGKPLYSTKLRALKALRYVLEQQICEALRAVDREIELEQEADSHE